MYMDTSAEPPTHAVDSAGSLCLYLYSVLCSAPLHLCNFRPSARLQIAGPNGKISRPAGPAPPVHPAPSRRQNLHATNSPPQRYNTTNLSTFCSTSNSLRVHYSTYPFALPLCLAWPHLALPIPCSATPSALHPLTASPLAGPPGMEASPAPRSPPFTKVDLVERPFPFGPSPLSHALLCQIRASMEYTRHCAVDLLRIAAVLRVSACPAIIIASSQKVPM
ncbi:hypothetical protein CFAM422_006503 [Trichoderma lentiforme]|uniref:Uncharacterized protein n=1 Tax=Trichoderma lentiforme TaxID=1567552 RepID=A0A9P4XDY1_9HYPO|nr:hypothetical protein CFAM422_006503 [Trichoderma lentiforme]